MTTLPDEAALAAAEKRILDEAHRWGLHQSGQGRLGALEQLAMLQHFGAPTRLVDVSFNPYIALWFAVEVDDPQDGRVFAIDVTQRLINEDDKMREWEPMAAVPWKTDQWWNSRALAWRPPPIERRIAAQHGAFLLGGVPISSGPDGPIQWPKSTSAGAKWKIAEVRRFISVPLRMHKLDPGAGGVRPDGWPAYTFRVLGTAKSEIRMRLEKLFGFQHRTLFPDYPGFAKYATRGLFPISLAPFDLVALAPFAP